MAQIINPLYGTGPVNAGEQRLLERLSVKLPDDYCIIPNGEIPVKVSNLTQVMEYDCLIVAPHAIYHIENKDFAAPVTADDWTWQVGGRSLPNPLKSAQFKSKVLASKLVHHNPEWRKAKIITLITLSHPANQSKFGFDPHSDATAATFLLNDELYEFLQDAEKADKSEDAISDIQKEIAEYLAGQLRQNLTPKTHVNGYKIITELQRNEDFTEYLCEKESLIGNGRQYRIKEYPLDVAGLSPIQLEQHKFKVNNGNIAQDKISTSPYILPSHYDLNPEQTYLYEVTEDMGTRSLHNRMRQGTMTLMSKVKIIQDVAQALKVAHNEKVIHRNISPETICVMPDGSAALTNFSQAWFAEHTTAGGAGFTVKSRLDTDKSPYIAPELLDNFVCEESDLFSLGVVAYELLTGQKPFESTVMFKVAGEIPENKLPSAVVPDLPDWIDGLIKQTIALSYEDRFSSADELIDYINRNAFSTAPTQPTSTPSQKTLREIKVGDMVTGAVQLYEELGKGGFGRVFKAKNTITGRFFAIKLFDYSPSSIQDVISEYNSLAEITHNNVVKIHNCDKSLDGLFFTQMELLEGDNLGVYTKGDLRLPLSEIYKMAKEILSALVYMQEMPGGPMFHRDIKPNNIVWDKKNRYVLIDFNIATSTDDNSFAGTQPYMAPDLVKSSNRIEWDKSADTFSLGVTLYELLTHTYPWPGSDPCPRMNVAATDITSVCNHNFSDAFAKFMMKSIITDNQKRFRSAREMLDALLEIGVDGMLRKADTAPGVIHIDLTHGKTTDIVDYLNSLYSQSEHGNSGTRAAVSPSWLDRETYTETKLDKKLLRDIADLKYKLLIITGNAGDGKTAFLHKVEDIDPHKELLTNQNGAKFRIKGVLFESNYDGSQDEEEKANDQVLTEFFTPFMGLENINDAREGRVIAINEGRLVDFLSTRPELKALQDNIEDYFYHEGHTELLPGVMVINLNLRSVTAREGKEDSLLKSQIKKLTKPILWEKCKKCPIADKCFIKYNVDTFNDESAGDEVINRLEWLLRTIVYKRELHITMRDLRSFISFLLTRDYNCEQVMQMIEHIKADNILPEFYWQFYYFNITAAPFSYKGYFPFPTNDSNDRLVRLLKETDIAKVSLPSLDRDLYYNRKQEEDYLMFGTRTRSLLPEFDERNVLMPYYDMTTDDKFIAKERHASMIRHQYFEGQWRNSSFMTRLPYQSIPEFNDQLTKAEGAGNGECKGNIALAISKSEGCLNDELNRKYMLLSCSHISDPLSKSYRMFSLDEFELFVNKTPHLTEYIEYESDSLTFRHKTDHEIQLTVSLDLFEMLDFIKKGFNPSINDLQGKFIELQIFKNRLESKTYTEILVTKNNKKFSVIRLNPDKTLTIEPYKQEEA